MESPDAKPCECGHPERWVNDPMVPVGFDEEMNEYYVQLKPGGEAVMHYCFWCGGKLPESRRGSFFTEPSEEEVEEVRLLLREAKSHEDVLRILGPADELCDLNGFMKDPKTGKVMMRWDQHCLYSKRWKTLELHVPLIVEGNFGYSFHGHYIGKKSTD